MALITCSACHKRSTSTLPTCIHCGAPTPGYEEPPEFRPWSGAVAFGFSAVAIILTGAVAFDAATIGAFLALVPLAFALSGAVAGALWAAVNRSKPGPLRAAFAFGIGFLIPGVVIPFSLVSLQATVDPVWAAISWGLSLGGGGALAGRLLSGPRRREFVRAGWAGFLLGGVCGGPVGFTMHNLDGGLAVGVVIAYAIGGGAFAAIADARRAFIMVSDPNRRPR